MTTGGKRPQSGALRGTFTPWLYAIGTKIRQVSLREMAQDASVMAAGAIGSAKLFKTHSVCVNFDTTLWAEIVGCTVNREIDPPNVEKGGSPNSNPDEVRVSDFVKTLVEAIGRVKGALPEYEVLCAICGPATLAGYLEVSAPVSRTDQFTIGELLTEFVNILCENNIQNIVILEDEHIGDDELIPWIEGGHYARIAKLAQHYAVETTFLCSAATLNEQQLEAFDLFTYVAGDAKSTIRAKFENAIKAVSVGDFGTGNVTIPEGLEELDSGSYMVTTEWDLDPSHEFEDIQSDVATIRAFLEESNERI